ncbi:iron chelate uptake ABC transporter family permease subunit [Pleomorphomonas carboxyditropha]|uniref:Enterobactin ABC transporter permease n=1 Tax=Pleomorphomonas carboxyditropha TaxID=2023338 RepID=A0A2G9WNB1_9HYPH|nr:iron chelate uptake ABC transporter family permease subunit [Pleomorphomonas carboxyditropha]PIO96197.1 enterobactin ABC transporter permease [Pleomorphomonas carboxyditropha]
MPPDRAHAVRRVTLVVALLAALSALAFMTVGVRGSWSFVLAHRGVRLAALVTVAYAIALSTVLFQTLTGNRILTPAVMGFDALFLLLQTALVVVLGGAGAGALDPRLLFSVECLIMVGLSGLLFRLLFRGEGRNLPLVVLAGLLFGALFRSLASFLQRVMDPNDFLVLQGRTFASFNVVDPALIGVAAFLALTATAVLLPRLSELDVLVLGREKATGLGIDTARLSAIVFALVAVLVSASTALVGPTTFFGLLVANLAYLMVPSARHADVLPVAVGLAVITLVGGQMLLERLLGFGTALSIVIDFVGGVVFLLILFRAGRR